MSLPVTPSYVYVTTLFTIIGMNLLFTPLVTSQTHPLQVHIALADEPNSMAITWVTIENTPETIVEYGLAPADVAVVSAVAREERSSDHFAPSGKEKKGTDLNSTPETRIKAKPEVTQLELEAAETIRVGSQAKAGQEIIKDVEESKRRNHQGACVPCATDDKGKEDKVAQPVVQQQEEDERVLDEVKDRIANVTIPTTTTEPTTTTTEVPALPVYISVGESFRIHPGVTILDHRYIHRVKLTDLEPNQKYWYRCGGPDFGWSKNYTFKTMPAGSDWSPRLAIFGDLGLKDGKILGHLIELAEEENIDLVHHTGDIGYDMHLADARSSFSILSGLYVGDSFIQDLEPMASKIPYMVSPGNHESFGNFSNYKSRFWMPGEHDNMMYTYTFGPMRVISISTEVYHSLEFFGGTQPFLWQYVWLENVLKKANLPENRRRHPWILLMGHRPMYCSNRNFRGCKRGLSRVRDGGSLARGKGLEKLMYDYGVDLGFWGHQHSYERMWPTYNKTIYNGSLAEPYVNPRAPIHFTVGCAGNHESRHGFLPSPPPWSAFRSLRYGFIHLTVANKTHLHLQYLPDKSTSPLVDEMWIVKDAHGPYPRLFPLDSRSRVKLPTQKSHNSSNRRRKLGRIFG